MKNQRKYSTHAYISYSEKDEYWAKWLQKKLESYRLPSIIRKQAQYLPKRIHPVFRDKMEHTANLDADQNHELESSKFLIVICSTNSAYPDASGRHAINRNVEHFIEKDRAGHIIPFIVEGQVGAADPDQECFCPALLGYKGKSILGANVQEIGNEQAFVKIVSKILNLKYDVLWDRHGRRKRRNKLLLFLSIFCTVLLAGVGGFFIWDYNRTKITYYADYIEKWGLPEGIMSPLSENEVAHRHRTWKFEFSRKKLRRVSNVNSDGLVQAIQDSEALQRVSDRRFYYRSNGNLERLDEYDHLGNILRHLNFSPDLSLVEIKTDNKDDTMQHHGKSPATAKSSESMSGFVVHEQQYDSLGRLQKWFSLDMYGRPANDADGIVGQIYEYSDSGLLKSIRYFDMEYELCSTRQGIAGRAYKYNDIGSLDKVIWLNLHGEPTINSALYAVCSQKYDAFGNIIEKLYFGVNGKPCLNKDGYARVAMKYDERGNLIEQAFLGIDGKPCLIETSMD